MNLTRHVFATAGMGLLALGLAGPASAQTVADDFDVRVLAETCANCHGPDGRSPGAIPTIAGTEFDYLLEQLLAFKAGEVPGTTVMTRIATGYTDEELEAIALYFSEIEP